MGYPVAVIQSNQRPYEFTAPCDLIPRMPFAKQRANGYSATILTDFLLCKEPPTRIVRLGGAMLPGLEIRHQQPLHVISKRLTDA